ncbi:MAG: winged helix-turn-helix domain-containing protein, partial [Methylomonas sp.]
MAGSLKHNNISTTWVNGELRLAGLDSRMIGLLRAIDQSGSINQAAKQVGLSYKGAWQIIERANNGSPKTLVSTATGGSKGGGTSLTEAGHSLLELFTNLEQQHRQFLEQLNRNLADDPDTVLLLQRLVVKTSARNQIFGIIA